MAVAEKKGVVRLRLITHNARLVDARKEMGLTAPEFAGRVGISTTRLRYIETLKKIPSEDEICRIAIFLEKMPEYLFPDKLLLAVERDVFAKRKVELEAPQLDHLIEVKQPMLITDGGIGEVEERVDAEALRDRLEKVFRVLTEREVVVLKMRFGLAGKPAMNLEEVGKVLDVTRERVRQIEGKAMRKLRHPSLSRFIEGKSMNEPKPRKVEDDWRTRSDHPKTGICDVCGHYVGMNKGQHILVEHPEYPVKVKIHIGGWGNEYPVYYCRLCNWRNGSPAYMVKHIQEVHPEVLKSYLVKLERRRLCEQRRK